MSTKIELLDEGGVTSARGFVAGATYVGIKHKTKDPLDLAILFSEVSCTAAGMFTTNKIKAATVLVDQQILEATGKARAVIVNSGCANACTGEQGLANVRITAAAVAKSLGIEPEEVMVASTGVIGVQLPMDKITEGISRIVLSQADGDKFTRAIMTTDTRPKSIAYKVNDGEITYTIGGTAKGAGMIHPNMATMLGFITTDAKVEIAFLQASLKQAVESTFNMITVDGDTSTNDTVLLLADGLAANPVIEQSSNTARGFQEALYLVCLYLAKSIARDGEGATRLIDVQVNGAQSLDDARKAARTIASSPLVKTAVHGSDPNWGRIVAAAGRSGAEMDPEKTDVWVEDMQLFKAGAPLPFDKKAASRVFGQEEVHIRVELNLGNSNATAWGCDLSEEYVVINSEYTT